jgi:hypothetical protein
VPKTSLSITMLISAAVCTAIAVLAAAVGFGGENVLPGDSGAIVRTCAAVFWLAYVAAMARDRGRLHIRALAHRLDQVAVRQDANQITLNQVHKDLGEIKKYLGMMTDAVTAYGDERETIGRLAYYRKELADDDRTDELAKVRNLRQAR